MIIYIDIVIIENIVMNYIILMGVGIIQRTVIKRKRILSASTLGALCTIIIYCFKLTTLINIIFKLLLAIVMIIIAYNPQSTKKMCKNILLFFINTFIIGGCGYGILNMLYTNSLAYKNGIIYGNYPFVISIVAGIIGLVLIELAFRFNKRMINRKDLLVDLVIGINNEELKIRAFIDSGNTLKSTSNNMPVIIVEEDKISKLLKKGGDIDKIKISYKSIGKQDGIMYGIKPEYIKIVDFDKNEIVKRKVILGLYKDKISSKYSALIGLDILNLGGSNNENKRINKQNLLQHI